MNRHVLKTNRLKMEETGVRVDTFVDGPGSGNAAVVFALPSAQETAWMQQIAYDMKVSETAFFYPTHEGFHLRWFSPIIEVDLCGHGTLAAAHVLREAGYFTTHSTARFVTRSGVLTARPQADWIELDFPALAQQATIPTPELVNALGTPFVYVGTDGDDYLVELESEDAVRSLRPDIQLLSTVRTRAIIVTSRATSSRYDIVSRVFAPSLGIDEDPVTGSAHCSLGPYWMAKLRKRELIAYQASSRGGLLHLRMRGSRILLSGKAITVLNGIACPS
jgi:PhzF family phenazine biosynthesis protein